MPQHIWFNVPIAPPSFTEGVQEFWEEWYFPFDLDYFWDQYVNGEGPRPVAGP